MEDIVKCMEILTTPEVVLQSTFSCFLLARLGLGVGPAVHAYKVLSFSI